jgi:hypothetical protein
MNHQIELLSMVDVPKLDEESRLISHWLQNIFRNPQIQTIRLVQTTLVDANNFGCCLETGEDVDKDIDRAGRDYEKSASERRPSGLYKFECCLADGKRIEQDLIRAAKYYRISAEHSFGICLERGISFHSNLFLAARYCQWSAEHGNPDGTNNLEILPGAWPWCQTSFWSSSRM